jgi:hypothetical protein
VKAVEAFFSERKTNIKSKEEKLSEKFKSLFFGPNKQHRKKIK